MRCITRQVISARPYTMGDEFGSSAGSADGTPFTLVFDCPPAGSAAAAAAIGWDPTLELPRAVGRCKLKR